MKKSKYTRPITQVVSLDGGHQLLSYSGNRAVSESGDALDTRNVKTGGDASQAASQRANIWIWMSE